MLKENQNWTVVKGVKSDFIQKSNCNRGKRPQYRTGLGSEYNKEQSVGVGGWKSTKRKPLG